ncbi:LPXTG cell wall anchor domain-containing protein [Lentilactobacillus buchneri]|uniref:Gram-positive cocci surface proteins LPxTG domain-containing protein n=1 Tax=Lentilactobacillus buchneri subsp. silagei CD034 TaxID=1071400 RepID=J9W2H7_LENBU|nr:LPXTG cell wall anchor domain-containing protein [Lentilactobacillus buchneri]MCC6100727.1 LPXTG cell wall anchor domain-containing protein [Lactobacillus sp.]AFR99234.1 hypothetical protein LBUCD034_0123 [Lentilactobacillus buchneri subsp. silagei CD034]MCT2900673.1 LPXTG cell wall anchor domain-containing protein [Lentilactobacillus buchneri]MCT3542539.1 LPXTG cell wall anchor domain-containing protein [Lentilactobacillus buchneri]MCT3545941.1 LPXTG cell wall anchor domain-containing prot
MIKHSNKQLKRQLLLAAGVLVGVSTTTGLDQSKVHADDQVPTTATTPTTQQPATTSANTDSGQVTFQAPTQAEQTATDPSTPQAYGTGKMDTQATEETVTPTTSATESATVTQTPQATTDQTTQTTTQQPTVTAQTQQAPQAQQTTNQGVTEQTSAATQQTAAQTAQATQTDTQTTNHSSSKGTTATSKHKQRTTSQTPKQDKKAVKTAKADTNSTKQNKAEEVKETFVLWKNATGQDDRRNIIYRQVTINPQTRETTIEHYLFEPDNANDPEGTGKYRLLENNDPLIDEINKADDAGVVQTTLLGEDSTAAFLKAVEDGDDNVLSYKIVRNDTNDPRNIPEVIKDNGVAMIVQYYFKNDGNKPNQAVPVYVAQFDNGTGEPSYFSYNPDSDAFDIPVDSSDIDEAIRAGALQVGYTTDEDLTDFQRDYEASIAEGSQLTTWNKYKVITEDDEDRIPNGASSFTHETAEQKDYVKPSDANATEIHTVFIGSDGYVYKYDSESGDLVELSPEEQNEYNAAAAVAETKALLKKGGSKLEEAAIKSAVKDGSDFMTFNNTPYIVKSAHDNQNFHPDTVFYKPQGGGSTRYYAENTQYGVKITPAKTSYIYGMNESYAKSEAPLYTYAVNERYGVKVEKTVTPPGGGGGGNNGGGTPGVTPETPETPTPTPTPTPETPTPQPPVTEIPSPDDIVEQPQGLPAKDDEKEATSSSDKKTQSGKKEGLLYLKVNPNSASRGMTSLQALSGERGKTFKYANSTTDATVKPAVQQDLNVKGAAMLPQTGDTHSANWLALLGLSLLGLLGIGKLRKFRS